MGCCVGTVHGSVWSVSSPSNSPTLSSKTSGNSSRIPLRESSMSSFLMFFRAYSLRSLHSTAETVESNWSRLNRIKFSFWQRLQLKIGCTFSFTTMTEAVTFLLLTGLISSTVIVPSVLTFFPLYTVKSSFLPFFSKCSILSLTNVAGITFTVAPESIMNLMGFPFNFKFAWTLWIVSPTTWKSSLTFFSLWLSLQTFDLAK